ncbi:hypothetical protein [Pantoea stewartii]
MTLDQSGTAREPPQPPPRPATVTASTSPAASTPPQHDADTATGEAS